MIEYQPMNRGIGKCRQAGVGLEEAFEFNNQTLSIIQQLGVLLIRTYLVEPLQLQQCIDRWSSEHFYPLNLSSDEINNIEEAFGLLETIIGQVNYLFNPETKKLYDKDDMDRLFVQINQVTQIYYHFTGVQIVWENLREDNQAELARIANRHLESLDLIFDALNMLMTRVNQFLNLGNSSGLGTGITADEE